jgi:hypothetical protein
VSCLWVYTWIGSITKIVATTALAVGYSDGVSLNAILFVLVFATDDYRDEPGSRVAHSMLGLYAGLAPNPRNVASTSNSRGGLSDSKH